MQKLFSQTKMRGEYEIVNSLGLRKLFRDYATACISGDKHHCNVWFVIDKERFFSWTERRADIYDYTYVVEVAVAGTETCVRIHAVERTRKP
jgi:hypothetical protein